MPIVIVERFSLERRCVDGAEHKLGRLIFGPSYRSSKESSDLSRVRDVGLSRAAIEETRRNRESCAGREPGSLPPCGPPPQGAVLNNDLSINDELTALQPTEEGTC